MSRVNRRKRTSYFLFLLVLLSSGSFFNPFGILSPVMTKFLYYGINVFTWTWALRRQTRVGDNFPKRYFKGMMLGIVASIFMVELFQKQNLATTLITYLPTVFSWMFFPLLMLLKIEKEKILKTISILVVVSMVAYIVNTITYPNVVFGQEKEEYDMSRGIVRLGIPYFVFFVLMFFYYINKWVRIGKKKYMMAIVVLGTFIILSVTRQYILLSFSIGVWLIMRKASTIKRIAVVLACAFFVLLVLPEIPVYKAMLELTEEQAMRNKYEQEDVRISAWKFYTIENQTNGLTPIFGNGIPALEKSEWGNKFNLITNSRLGGNGCYAADVGWAGFFYYFGGIATFCLLMMLARAVILRKEEQDGYLGYWMLFIIITSIASAPILYYYQVTDVSIVLYLIYGKFQEKNKINSRHRPQLQQLRGHNQLH